MKLRALLVCLLVLAGLVAAQQVTAAPTCDTNWIGATTGGSWGTATNWDAGLPDQNKVACIPLGVTVTHGSTSDTVKTLLADGAVTMTGGTLTIDGTSDPSHIDGWTQSGGTLAGDATVQLTNGGTWSGGQMDGIGTTVVPAGKTLTLPSGVALWGARVLDVAGLVQITSQSAGISNSGTPKILVESSGVLRKTVGSSTASPTTSFVSVAVENDGKVESTADKGVLSLSAGTGTSTGTYGSAGALGTVLLAGSTHTLGNGAKLLDGATITGTVDVASGAVATAANASQTGGSLGGPGKLSITGPFTWSGGQHVDDGTTDVASGAIVTLPSGVALWDTRTLDVSGTVLLASQSAGISNSGTPKIVVEASGVLRKTVGSSTASPTTSFVSVAVENDGKVESTADKGVLSLSAGTGTSTGTYGSAGALGTVLLAGSTHTLGNAARLLDGATITGTVDVASGATATAANASQTGGSLGGPGKLSITGPFTWSGGQHVDDGTTDVRPGVTVTLPSGVALWDTRTLDVSGTVLLASQSSGISNSATPKILVRSTGILRKTVGSSTASPTTSFISVPLENDGKVESTADKGILRLNNGSGGTSTGTYGSTGAAGVVQLGGGTHTLGNGAKLLGGSELLGTETIPAAATVTANGAKMTAGTLGGAGDLSIPGGTFTWSGGTINGSGAVTVAAPATATIAESVNLGETRRLDIAGLLLISGDYTIGNSDTALVHVLAGGTLRKTAGTNSFGAFLIPPLRNDGAVESRSGNLRLWRGASDPSTGTFSGQNATQHVIFAGTGFQLAGSARLLDFSEIAGDVSVVAGDTLPISAEIFQNGGTLTGDISLSGTLHWITGTQDGPGTTTVTSAGKILLDDSCFNATLGDGRRLDNQGLISLTKHSALSFGFGDVLPVLENSGTIRLDDSVAGGCTDQTGIFGSGVLHNTGTIEKIGGAGEGDVRGVLDNDGTVRVTAGLLRLESEETVQQSGTFTSTGSATYVLDSGVFVLASGAVLGGRPEIGDGDLRIPEGMTVDVPSGATLRQNGGTVSGDGTLRVLGTLTWLQGDHRGGGTTLIETGGTATLQPADPADHAFASIADSRALINRGTFNVTDATLEAFDGGSITNRGTMVLGGDAALEGSGFGDGFSSLLHNVGTLRKTGATTISADIPIDNDGTIDVQGGKLDATQLQNFTSDFFFGGPRGAIVGGTYLLKGKLGVPQGVEVIAGRIVLDGADAGLEERGFPDPTDALASLHRIAGGGELVLANGKSVSSGDGTGTFSNAGILDLGAGTTFNAAEGFAQVAGGVLRTRVPSSGAPGKLAVTGDAALGGRLDVVSPAHPATGTESPIVTYGSHSGDFPLRTGLSGFVLRFDPGALVLRSQPTFVARQNAAPPVVSEPETPAAPEQDATASQQLAAAALTVRGPWARRGAYLVATRRGARLIRRAVSGRGLDIVALTGPRAGSVRVTWAGRSRTVSLRSSRPDRRTLRVFRGAARTGTVVVRTRSARRVAIAAILVRR